MMYGGLHYKMEFRSVFRLLAYMIAAVEARVCIEEEGLTVIPVCSARTITSSDVAISTNGTQDVPTTGCRCYVTVYTVGDVQPPTLYYTGPGYPNCGVEFDVNGDVLTCQNGFIILSEGEYEITYRNALMNSWPEACLLFLSGGMNIEFKVTCQQPPHTVASTTKTTTLTSTRITSNYNTTATIIKALATSPTKIPADSTSASETGSTSIMSSTNTPTSDSIVGTDSYYEINTTSDEDLNTSWQQISSAVSFEVSTISSNLTNPPSDWPISTDISTKQWTTSTPRFGEKTTETDAYSLSTSGDTVTTSKFVGTSSTRTLNFSSFRTTDRFISTNGEEVDLSTKFSAVISTKDEQFPIALVISLCSGILAVTIFVVLFMVVRRRRRSKRTSIPWTVNGADPPSYIDAYSDDHPVIVDDSVYFTGIPVILDGQDHVDQPHIDDSLTTPRETGVYAVVMKQPNMFVSLPTPRLESFQWVTDPIESDIEEDILESIEKVNERAGPMIKKERSVSFSHPEKAGSDRLEYHLEIRQNQDHHPRSVSFRETIQYDSEDDIFIKQSKNTDTITEIDIREIKNKQPRSASFHDTIKKDYDPKFYSEIKKDYIQSRKTVSFREAVKTTSTQKTIRDSKTEPTDRSIPPGRNTSKDIVREMFLKDLRKALQRRDIERHAF